MKKMIVISIMIASCCVQAMQLEDKDSVQSSKAASEEVLRFDQKHLAAGLIVAYQKGLGYQLKKVLDVEGRPLFQSNNRKQGVLNSEKWRLLSVTLHPKLASELRVTRKKGRGLRLREILDERGQRIWRSGSFLNAACQVEQLYPKLMVKNKQENVASYQYVSFGADGAVVLGDQVPLADQALSGDIIEVLSQPVSPKTPKPVRPKSSRADNDEYTFGDFSGASQGLVEQGSSSIAEQSSEGASRVVDADAGWQAYHLPGYGHGAFFPAYYGPGQMFVPYPIHHCVYMDASGQSTLPPK